MQRHTKHYEIHIIRKYHIILNDDNKLCISIEIILGWTGEVGGFLTKKNENEKI